MKNKLKEDCTILISWPTGYTGGKELKQRMANAKDQGPLVRLPCKVGARVWVIYEWGYPMPYAKYISTSGEVKEIRTDRRGANAYVVHYQKSGNYVNGVFQLGESMFLAEEKANAKVERLNERE